MDNIMRRFADAADEQIRFPSRSIDHGRSSSLSMISGNAREARRLSSRPSRETLAEDLYLRQIDFALLIIFEEVMSSGQLAAAADRLALTESAVSHAMKRLSRVLGLGLFERRQRGMTPTAEALRIAPLVREILTLGRMLHGHGAPSRPS